MMKSTKLKTLVAALCASCAVSAVNAADLTVGFADAISSLDPQLNNHAGDHNASHMMFGALTAKEVDGVVPYAAESWTLIDPTTWEFKIRDNANWTDGTPVTSEDVKFSYERASDVPGSIASYRGFLRTVDSVEIVDDKTLRVITNVPNPLLPINLSMVYLISKHVGETASSNAYNSGEALVGMGPYTLEGYTPGDRLKMTRNEDFFGPKYEWDNVEYRYIPNPAARSAALLSGDVDVIDKVSISDLDTLNASNDVTVHSYPGLRVLLLQPSFNPEPSELITDNAGKLLDVNPLLDVKVRQAMSIAINREAIVDRIMRGGATVANQWMPADSFGFDPEIEEIAYDPEAAKALLAEAGYPDGFNLTMHVPGDRYPMATETAQAVAQFWTRVGITTQVESVPYSVYGGKANRNEYAMSMIGWGNGTGEGTYAMTTILATSDKEKGLGATNWGRYSSERLDAALKKATSEFDDAKREEFIREGAKAVSEEVGVIPLFHYKMIWASRNGLKVVPWTSDRSVAMQVSTKTEK